MRRLPAVAALGCLVVAACRSSGTGGLDLERMVIQPRYDPYEESDLFPDGKVMRTPPEGTLPFGEPDLSPEARTGLRAGRPVDRIPVEVTPELVRTGRRRFEVVCAPCHGVDGNATTPVAAAMELRPPPSLHGEAIRALPPGRLFQVIGTGFGLMPSYASDLPPRERWAVIAYVRALQLSRHLVLDSLPPALRREMEAAVERGSGEGGP